MSSKVLRNRVATTEREPVEDADARSVPRTVAVRALTHKWAKSAIATMVNDMLPTIIECMGDDPTARLSHAKLNEDTLGSKPSDADGAEAWNRAKRGVVSELKSQLRLHHGRALVSVPREGYRLLSRNDTLDFYPVAGLSMADRAMRNTGEHLAELNTEVMTSAERVKHQRVLARHKRHRAAMNIGEKLGEIYPALMADD